MLSLTATELPRFMECNGLRLLEKISPINKDTTDADEGNAAHWMVEQVFKGDFSPEELVDRKAFNDVFITSDMIEHSEEYLNEITGNGEVEVKTTHSKPDVYEIRGRADHVYFDGTVLYVDDFKYGWGIVEPENNWTLLSHAIGWYINNQNSVPHEIMFRIFQPRPFHPEGSVRTWVISFTDLMGYWKQLDEVLSNPSDLVKSGSHCKNCRSYTNCPASQIMTMNSIDVSETSYNSEVSNKELSYIMDEIKRAKNVLKQAEDAYIDLTISRVQKGEIVPDYFLNRALSNSNWKNNITPEIVQMMTGIDVSKKKLMTPKQAEKEGIPSEIIETLCERKSTGVKLVRIDTNKKAKKLFGGSNGEKKIK